MIIDSEANQNYSLESILNKVIQGDALQILKKIPDNSADLVFIDPPYFLQLPRKKLKRWNVKTDVEGVEDEWDKFVSFEEYDEFIKTVLLEMKRIMKDNATIWVISTYHSIFRIGKIMQDLGYWILNNIIWAKTNPMPNWLGVRFTNATETMIWATKNKKEKKYFFDKVKAKEFGIGKVGANLWLIPLCTGKERLKDENGKKLHATQKPQELLRRIIQTTSKEGDIIFDPLAGMGTTGFVAKALKRQFIMIEKEKKYTEGIRRRFQESPVLKENKIRKEIE
ncbi:MAG: site-specific DNA-methyltransferase [Candidatus Heimdallarchaeota archaeon]|nr:site-specific DNA-methyltransferase [Candidatus Heimdallarchaeota archaeon]MCK4770727.1 site-specific DNA-methyltransferase [Candidatus Heimdallarchaeota archaeon]